MTVKYTGHGANTGGLQGHSVGGLYPLCVFGQETAEGTRYGVMNLARGITLYAAEYTCKEAHDKARELAAWRDRCNAAADTIARITTQGGHHA